MKKYMAFALAFLLVATLFTACGRGMVSNNPSGMITDSMGPSATTRPVNPVPTMTIPATRNTESSEATGTTGSASNSEESTNSTLTDSVNPSNSTQDVS